MIRNTVFLAVVVAVTAFSLTSHAGPPPEVPVQGVITDNRGIPLDGFQQIIFSIYDQSEAGNQLWTEEQTVDVVNGLFTTHLVVGIAVFRDNPELWLGVQVVGDEEGKRVKLRQTPYSVYSKGDVFPVGTVLMYDGGGIAEAAVRTAKIGAHANDTVDFELYGNWYVCNGQDIGGMVLPNLIDRFVRGRSGASAATGGSDNHRHLIGWISTAGPSPSIRFFDSSGRWEECIRGAVWGDGGSSGDDDTWSVPGSPRYFYSDYEDDLPSYYSVIFIIRKD